MLTITKIDKLIGHQFNGADGIIWEVADVLGSVQPPYEYRIELGNYSPRLYDPMTFNSTRKLLGTKTIILEREQKNGHYKMYNPKDNINSLNLDISLMDTQNKLIAAIEFIM